MSLFLGLTLLLRLVTDVLSDSYLKDAVFGHADTRLNSYTESVVRWSEALIILSVVRKVRRIIIDQISVQSRASSTVVPKILLYFFLRV